ncbi:MAG: OB-fold nucleic acid binding domain-containing protein [Candidatus Aenigmatarchaeota archaeon]
MQRIHAKDAVELEEGDTCTLGGWLQETKNLGGIAFMKIRDRTGVFQVVLSKDEMEEGFNEAVSIPGRAYS